MPGALLPPIRRPVGRRPRLRPPGKPRLKPPLRLTASPRVTIARSGFPRSAAARIGEYPAMRAAPPISVTEPSNTASGRPPAKRRNVVAARGAAARRKLFAVLSGQSGWAVWGDGRRQDGKGIDGRGLAVSAISLGPGYPLPQMPKTPGRVCGPSRRWFLPAAAGLSGRPAIPGR